MSKFNPKARHQARYFAVQASYQQIISHTDLSTLKKQFKLRLVDKKVDEEYFEKLIDGVNYHGPQLDELFIPFLSRQVKELDPIEYTIIRLATYELKEFLEIPYKVVINEALELTKVFGSIEGYKFVNGVLDQLAKKLRPIEANNT